MKISKKTNSYRIWISNKDYIEIFDRDLYNALKEYYFGKYELIETVEGRMKFNKKEDDYLTNILCYNIKTGNNEYLYITKQELTELINRINE